MRQTSQTHTKTPYPQAGMNGSSVDTQVLFQTTVVNLLLDLNRSQSGIRHGLDTMPERLFRVFHFHQHSQGPSRPASKLKEWALFLKVLFPWVIFLAGIVASIFRPSSMPGLVSLVIHSVMPQ